MDFDIDTLPLTPGRLEVVERKGTGHPDTICDALAEELSLAYSRFCREKLGAVVHHNVDKVLLVGGQSRAVFGGGEVLEPIDIVLAGRAVTRVGDVVIPLEQLADEGSRRWLGRRLHALDAAKHVRLSTRIRPGSADLSELFARKAAGAPALSNDTSIGVGFAPLSTLEGLALHVEQALNADAGAACPWFGEDIKVMGVRRDQRVQLTVACAFVAGHVTGAEDYAAKKAAMAERVRELAGRFAPELEVAVTVNAADDEKKGSVYLTVTGTSAEAGDDGEAGRGNRVNGLITPGRLMTIESVAGKNPVSHVGKLYNLSAGLLAQALVDELDFVRAAQCVLVSRIGSPITEPQLAQVRVEVDGALDAARVKRVEELAREQVRQVPALTDALLDGKIGLDRWPLRTK